MVRRLARTKCRPSLISWQAYGLRADLLPPLQQALLSSVNSHELAPPGAAPLMALGTMAGFGTRLDGCHLPARLVGASTTKSAAMARRPARRVFERTGHNLPSLGFAD